MKGFIKKSALGLCLGAGSISLAGCTHYREVVDPCYPERYNYEARKVVRDVFDAQAYNGHVLDQTIWNWHFEKDDKGGPTDKLSVAGMDHLKYLIRRRPMPDCKLFLQTANDLPAGTAVEAIPAKRQELDGRRIATVQSYLTALMAGRTIPVQWDIAVHDPAEVYLPASAVGGRNLANVTGAYPRLETGFQGILGTTQGFNIPTGGGGVGGSGGGGSGSIGTSGGTQGGGQGDAGAPPGN